MQQGPVLDLVAKGTPSRRPSPQLPGVTMSTPVASVHSGDHTGTWTSTPTLHRSCDCGFMRKGPIVNSSSYVPLSPLHLFFLLTSGCLSPNFWRNHMFNNTPTLCPYWPPHRSVCQSWWVKRQLRKHITWNNVSWNFLGFHWGTILDIEYTVRAILKLFSSEENLTNLFCHSHHLATEKRDCPTVHSHGI